MKLSALDLGSSFASVALAPELEAAGYHRHWIGEHQPQPSPTLILALMAGVTETMRVGTAGILLHYYSLSRAAFDFRFLTSCYDRRIDAGFCAGRIPDAELEADQLGGIDRSSRFSGFGERAATFVRNLREGDHPELAPEIWVHGTGLRSARLAASLGIAFGYSLFHQQSVDDATAANTYRDEIAGGAPYFAIAVGGICAATSEAAAELARRQTNPFFRMNVVGDPASCHDQLAAVADRYRADEVIFADLSPDPESQRESFLALARFRSRP